jgi:hypothetical protein
MAGVIDQRPNNELRQVAQALGIDILGSKEVRPERAFSDLTGRAL